MLKRKIESQLLNWKQKEKKYPLLLMGARQVGKTYSVRHFGQSHYKNMVELNFDLYPQHAEIFSGSLDVDTLLSGMSLMLKETQFLPGQTLLFFDEIQSCPNARTSLKAFAQDGRYDVIATGSLLGVKYKDVRSYPVGYEEYLEMYSLDFEEYLWAKGFGQNAIAKLHEYFEKKEPIPQGVHDNFMNIFREYMVIGGMPDVVQTFLDTANFQEARVTQQNIVKGYRNDIAKYAPTAGKSKAVECFLSVPKQLSRDYKKFKYSEVERGGSARKFGGSLEWLKDAMIVDYCYNLEQIELPLEGNANPREFKIYMNDTGLLVSMLDEGTPRQLIGGDLGLYKGALYENVVAETLTKAQRPLYYYARNGRMELDFITRLNNQPYAIEVKSALNTKAKSLRFALQKNLVSGAIKLSPQNLGMVDNVLTLPLYMAMFLF